MASKSKLGSAVIIGSGPGIGRHVAAKFAAQGFTKVALLARRAEKLHADRHFVISMANSKDIQVNIYPVDITNLSLFKTVLEQVQDDLGTPEFVSFNAAQVKPSTLLQFREEDLIEELTVSNDFSTFLLHLNMYFFSCYPSTITTIYSSYGVPCLATLGLSRTEGGATILLLLN